MATYAKPGQVFDRALGAHVDMVWTGRAARGIRFRPMDLFVVPFSVVWLGGVLSTFFSPHVPHHGTSAPPLFIVPFVLVGIYLFAGRFLVDMYLRSQTFYGLSRSDAYIVRDGMFSKVVVFNLKLTNPIAMKRSSDGSGTITFGNPPSTRSNADMWTGGSLSEFVGIPRVADVYALISASNA